MAVRPEAETGIEILYARAVGREVLAALVEHERAIEGWRGDGWRDWHQPDRPLRQGGVAEPLCKRAHQWRDDQRLNRWNDDRGRRRPERRGWQGELKACRGLAVFENLCRQRSDERERIQTCHACGRAERQSPKRHPRSNRELRHIAYFYVRPIERAAIHARG